MKLKKKEDQSVDTLVLLKKKLYGIVIGTGSTVFVAAIFIIARSWKEHTSQKICYICKMCYYSAIKKQ